MCLRRTQIEYNDCQRVATARRRLARTRVYFLYRLPRRDADLSISVHQSLCVNLCASISVRQSLCGMPIIKINMLRGQPKENVVCAENRREKTVMICYVFFVCHFALFGCR